MLRRALIVSAVVATGLVAAPAFAATGGESCPTSATVDNATIGVRTDPRDLGVCVDDGLSYHEVRVGTGTATTAGEVQFGGGVEVCTLSDYACAYAGTSTDTDFSGDKARQWAMPTACFTYVNPWYSHCASVFALGEIDGPLGSTMSTDHGVFVCDDSSFGFTCVSDEAVTGPARQATKNVTFSIAQ